MAQHVGVIDLSTREMRNEDEENDVVMDGSNGRVEWRGLSGYTILFEFNADSVEYLSGGGFANQVNTKLYCILSSGTLTMKVLVYNNIDYRVTLLPDKPSSPTVSIERSGGGGRPQIIVSTLLLDCVDRFIEACAAPGDEECRQRLEEFREWIVGGGSPQAFKGKGMLADCIERVCSRKQKDLEDCCLAFRKVVAGEGGAD